MKWATGSFFGDAITAAVCLWIMWAPVVAVHGLIAFSVWRRQRWVDRTFRRNRRGQGPRP